MKQKTLSIFEDLVLMHVRKDSQYLIESRANNIITSAINLLTLINETYSVEDAENLTRKLLNSIKTGDTRKFTRGLGRINEK